jgi:hypothetical protein
LYRISICLDDLCLQLVTERGAVEPTDASGSGRQPRCAAAGAEAGGSREGEKDQAARALGIAQ